MPRLRLKDMADPFSLTMTRAAVLARCSINAMHRSPMNRLCTALRVSLMRDYDFWHRTAPRLVMAILRVLSHGEHHLEPGGSRAGFSNFDFRKTVTPARST